MVWFALLYTAIVALSFILEAGTVWILCWALKAAGITTIAGWTVAFSWPLVVFVWLLLGTIRGIFKVSRNKNGV